MNKIKRHFTSDFKAKVALDLIRGIEGLSQVCSKYSVHPTQAGKWKSQAVQGLPAIFDNRPDMQLYEKDQLIDDLYRQIGKFQVELDWLKKKTHAG